MPVYNAALFLDRAIQSALDQPQVVELIAIDDASTDGSERILSVWAEKSDRVIYLPAISKEPQRAAAARNRGLAVATAPFIAFLDADDYYLPGRFTRTEAYFKAHPEVEGLVEPVEVVYEGNEIVQIQKYPTYSCRLNMNTWSHLSYDDLIAPGLQMNGLTVKSFVFDSRKWFDDTFFQLEDLNMVRHLLFQKSIIHILGCKALPVATYVHHSSNTTYRSEEKQNYSAHIESYWIEKMGKNSANRKHRLRLFYRYVIFKYQTASWARWKKLILYPFLFLFEGVKKKKYLK